MRYNATAATLSLLMVCCVQLTACAEDVATEAEPGKGVTIPAPTSPAPSEMAPDNGLPDRIGGFCLVNGCAAPTMAAGDLACQDAADLPFGCCIADVCWRGFRFGPTCVNVGAASSGETCPNDADADGLCSYLDRWYTSC